MGRNEFTSLEWSQQRALTEAESCFSYFHFKQGQARIETIVEEKVKQKESREREIQADRLKEKEQS